MSHSRSIKRPGPHSGTGGGVGGGVGRMGRGGRGRTCGWGVDNGGGEV